ncbi:MAG: GerMN domain-containing protein [Paenibacillus sp.]|nr:GerMN domain-containing protein [Paenibacillus sp.]
MKTKLGYAGLSVILMLVMAGCGEKPGASAANNSQNSPAVVSGAGGNAVDSDVSGNSTAEATAQPTNTNNSAGTDNNATPSEAPAQQMLSKTIDVFFTDSQLMELLQAKAEISYTESDPSSKYMEAFKALQTSENSEHIPLWKKIELKSLKFENGQIEMDIHKPIEAQLGAGGESFAMTALAKTLFQFEEVQSIEVLLDGEKVESLMGHVELEHPMTRDNSGYTQEN